MGKRRLVRFLWSGALGCVTFLAADGMRLGPTGPIYEVPYCPDLDLADEVTLEAWVKAMPMGRPGGRILDRSIPGTQDGYMLDTYPSNSLRILNAAGILSFDAKLGAGSWHHVVGVYSLPNRRMELYLDGRLVASAEVKEPVPMRPAPVPLRIGADQNGGNRFNGWIRRAAIYRRALEASEITKRYLSDGTVSISNGVLGEWVFSDNTPSELNPVAGKLRLRLAEPDREVRFDGAIEAAEPITDPYVLWYQRPASKWVEALPLGNGRLGAMVFGGIDRERIQLNEDTLWAGGPYDPNNPEAAKYLDEARSLIFEGKYRQADELIGRHMMARPLRQMPYQPLGDLLFKFANWNKVKAYRRSLDLRKALAKTEFVSEDGVRHIREVFISPVDQVLVWHQTASTPGSVNLEVRFVCPHSGTLRSVGSELLIFEGTNPPARGIDGALRFVCALKVAPAGGRLVNTGQSIVVEGADDVLLLFAAATSYRRYDDVGGNPYEIVLRQISEASHLTFPVLFQRHVEKWQSLFDRVWLRLGNASVPTLPTDERIRRFAEDKDPALAVQYFQFGRYLMMASSWPGTQPANLQGIWNEHTAPPWDSKYTININTEMNYWLPEPAALPECVEPLIRLVKEISETGARTAHVMWKASGWVAHHNTDLWRATAPIDGPMWGFWPLGGAWLSLHLWEHFLYTGDTNFLRSAYPILKGAAQFFLDTLVREPRHGWLVTCPSLSPENAHPGGVSICAGPTMDMQILRDLFMACIRASEVLGTDEQMREIWRATRAQLAPHQIGKAGQLQEWLEDWDLESPERHHRHVSHLYGLFPSSQIHPRRTPELAQAARRSLELRGDDATGWGLAWRLNLWARLGDGEHAYKILRMLLSPSRTYPNMFDAHPPFQIDGNFGGARGILEMLVQSLPPDESDVEQRFEIDLLPALPRVWDEGELRGVRTLGGAELSIRWKAGQLERVEVRSLTGWPLRVRFRENVWNLDLNVGDIWIWTGNGA